jgi:hypothetical protein
MALPKAGLPPTQPCCPSYAWQLGGKPAAAQVWKHSPSLPTLEACHCISLYSLYHGAAPVKSTRQVRGSGAKVRSLGPGGQTMANPIAVNEKGLTVLYEGPNPTIE